MAAAEAGNKKLRRIRAVNRQEGLCGGPHECREKVEYMGLTGSSARRYVGPSCTHHKECSASKCVRGGKAWSEGHTVCSCGSRKL